LHDTLGEIHMAKGDHEKAERHFSRALDIRSKALGESHPDLSETLNHLAALCRKLERHDAAEGFEKRASAIRRTAAQTPTTDATKSDDRGNANNRTTKPKADENE